jgi:predicted transcriptional regulator
MDKSSRDTKVELTVVESGQLNPVPAPESIAELFHRLNRVIPENQIVVKVSSTTKVCEAMQAMKKAGYSQVPVVEAETVLGVFSYRSLAEGVMRMRKTKMAVGDLPVEEFVEKAHFARVTDDLATIFDWLDRNSAVLVGEQDRLQAIVTAMDVLRYLYGVASPFVLLAEIELALRALISIAVEGELFAKCAKASLTSKYGPDKVPTRMNEMDFNDYIQLVGHGDNWKYFAPIFGGMRETVRVKLEEIRDLRNDVFHFKRELTPDDHENLVQDRDWMLMRARKADARLKCNQV